MYWFNQYWGCMPIDGKLSKKKLANMQNNIEFQNFFSWWMQMATQMFQWEGLPDTCDERFLERSFVLYGRGGIVKKNGSYLTPGMAGTDGLTLYGYPANCYAWGLNGWNEKFRLYVPGADDSATIRKAAGSSDASIDPQAVMGYDNPERYPPVAYIFSACRRMADLMRTMDVTAENMKTPYIIACDESQLSSVKEAIQQRDINIATIISSKTLTTDQFKVWPTPVDGNNLMIFWTHLRNIEAQLMEYLGIDCNANSDKMSGVSNMEVQANNEAVQYNLQKRLYMRQQFAEQVNEVFGLNISVKVRKDEEVFEDDEADDLSGIQDDGSGAEPVSRDED